MTLPDFLIIGAAKAGTTWLVSCLRRHPEVFIPLEEIHYWTRNPGRRDAGQDWYSSHFREARPGQRVGENSNSYLMRPEAAELIARDIPEVKLVSLLRNPVERAYSSYCMKFRYGELSRDVSAYLDPAGPDEAEIVNSSLYCRKLEPYLARFPRSQLHFALFEDIAMSSETLLNELCQFLGIEPRAGEMDIGNRVNARDSHWPLPAVHRAYATSAALRGLNRGIRGSWLHTQLRALLSRPVVYPPFPDALRARLTDFYRDDVAQLSEIVGRDLSFWLRSGSPDRRTVAVAR